MFFIIYKSLLTTTAVRNQEYTSDSYLTILNHYYLDQHFTETDWGI